MPYSTAMTPELEQALRQESEVSITTYDTNDRPGSVPIWFVYEAGRVYMATEGDSRKVHKLRANPWVRLAFRRRNIPTMRGRGRICTEEDLVLRVAPILNDKYGSAWGDDAQMARRLLGGDIVLLEITPLTQTR